MTKSEELSEEQQTEVVSTPPARVELPPTQRRWVTGGIMLGMALSALEATVVSTAMPTVVARLGGIEIYSWVFSMYLLTSTVTMPVWGKLSDLYGRRRFYLIGVALFLIGSALSGQADSMRALIVYRAVQGLGAGALLPLGMTIIGDIYTLKERSRMQGFFSGVWGLASIIGPLLGGFITDHFSWRWVFYFNIPFGVAAAAVIGLALKEPLREKQVRIDYKGVASFATAVAVFLLALNEVGRHWDWHSPPFVSLVVVSVLSLLAFAHFEREAEEPIIPHSLFKSNRIFRAAVVNGFFAGMAMYGSLSFLPLFVQGVKGTNAMLAGSVLVPMTISWVACSIIGSRMLLKVGYRLLVMVGMVALSAGFAILVRLDATVNSWTVIYASMLLLGMGMGLSMVTMLIAVQNSVPREQLGIATSATQFFRIIGGAIGVAVMGSVMAVRLQSHLAHWGQLASRETTAGQLAYLSQHPDVLVDPMQRAHLPPNMLVILRGALADALHQVFIIGLAMAVIALATAFLVPGGKAQEHALQPTKHPEDTEGGAEDRR